MAILYSGRASKISRQDTVLAYLRQHLPDDYLLVPNMALPGANQASEIELVIIKDNAIVTVEITDWPEPPREHIFSDTGRVGSAPQYDLVRRAGQHARRLARYLRRPGPAGAVFDDARVVYSVPVLPVVIFTHPEADIEVQSQKTVKLLRLAEAVEIISQADFGRRWCQINPPERRRLAGLLRDAAVLAPEEEPASLVVKPGSTLSGRVSAGDEGRAALAEATKAPDLVVTMLPAAAETEDTAGPGIPEGGSSPADALAGQAAAESSRFVYLSPSGEMDSPLSPDLASSPRRRPRRSVADVIRNIVPNLLGMTDRAEDQMNRLEQKLLLQVRTGSAIRPSQLVQVLERELEQTLHHLMKDQIAHNSFTLVLSVQDYARYQTFKERIEQELREHLQQIIEARDYQVMGPVRVEITPASALKLGACEVESRIDKNPAPLKTGPYLELLATGERFPLDKDLITLGRNQENDVYLGDKDTRRVVSRRHAHIRREHEQFVLYDGVDSQQSTCGTYLGGWRLNGLEGQPLKDGQHFVLGPVQRRNPDQPLPGSLAFVFHAEVLI